MQVTKFNLVTDLQIMLSNVTHSNFCFKCNKERGPIDQLYIELGVYSSKRQPYQKLFLSWLINYRILGLSYHIEICTNINSELNWRISIMSC